MRRLVVCPCEGRGLSPQRFSAQFAPDLPPPLARTSGPWSCVTLMKCRRASPPYKRWCSEQGGWALPNTAPHSAATNVWSQSNCPWHKLFPAPIHSRQIKLSRSPRQCNRSSGMWITDTGEYPKRISHNICSRQEVA